LTLPRDQVHALWNWERCRNRIRTLKGKLGFPNEETLRFLKLRLSLSDGTIYDELKNKPYEGSEVTIYFILYGHSNAKPSSETAKLIPFQKLSGGEAYYDAFARRVIQPLTEHFGSNPQTLLEATSLLGGVPQAHGEFSAKIQALPLVPLTIVLWAKTAEFPASANILFESNANHYLTTEELATLCGLTLIRLKDTTVFLRAK